RGDACVGLAAPKRTPKRETSIDCWDNAVAESFFATLKREEVPGAYETKAQAHQAIACYVHGFYNPNRMHSALAYLSPNDFAKKLKQNA
ncbi:MAG: integrase core domain-containing protein, partial [Azoarcus sp.]|nr:integrase core domain-containing protein [Azoarcus sp.]